MEEKPISPLSQLLLWTGGLCVSLTCLRLSFDAVSWADFGLLFFPGYFGVFTTFGGFCGRLVGHTAWGVVVALNLTCLVFLMAGYFLE